MNVARQRGLNIVGGIAAFLVGAGFFVSSLYIARLPVDPLAGRPAPEINVPACQSALRSLGFIVQRSPSEIVAESPTLDNPELSLSNASVGISLCHLPLLRFCMGKGCHFPAVPSGMSFALETSVAPSL